jgi:hypothetical protein
MNSQCALRAHVEMLESREQGRHLRAAPAGRIARIIGRRRFGENRRLLRRCRRGDARCRRARRQGLNQTAPVQAFFDRFGSRMGGHLSPLIGHRFLLPDVIIYRAARACKIESRSMSPDWPTSSFRLRSPFAFGPGSRGTLPIYDGYFAWGCFLKKRIRRPLAAITTSDRSIDAAFSRSSSHSLREARPTPLPPMTALTNGRDGPLSVGIDGLSQESEQGMRCGTQVPMPQLPPQL